MIVSAVTAVWRAQGTSIGEVCHVLPVQEIPFLPRAPFPASHPQGTECKWALVPSRGQRGKVKVPRLRTPLGQGILMAGCRQVSQLILPRSIPKNAFSWQIESCKHRNSSITLMWVPLTGRGRLGTMELQVTVALMLNQCTLLHLWLLKEWSTCEWHLQNSSWSSLLAA